MGDDLSQILPETPFAPDRHSPARHDYIMHLKSNGIIGTESEFIDHTCLVKAVYKDWQKRPQVGCVFAQQIAARPDQHEIDWAIFKDGESISEVHDLADRIAEHAYGVRNQEEAAAILLPALTDPSVLTALCKALGQIEGWDCKAEYNPSDKYDRFYVRVVMPLPPDTEAELLGLGPFDFLPLTRQAPVTALQIRTKPDDAEWRGPSDIKKAHLAHIPWPHQKTFKTHWAKTEELRRDILGGDDTAAKARVTFAIPSNHWDGGKP